VSGNVPEIAKLEAATAVFEAKKAGILEAIEQKRSLAAGARRVDTLA
jgi:hypothetical protein